MISDALRESIKEACLEVSVAPREIHLEFPENAAHGDYSTNVALMYAKGVGSAPRELAERIVESLQRKNIPDVERIKAAGAGFINFYLSDAFFARNLTEVVDKGENYGRGRVLEGERVMVEYTDPNPFKEFHIGHLMSNTIGESLARIVEWNGAVVVRACYQGDVGLHVAKTLWVAIGKRWPSEESPLAEKMKFLGEAYAAGSRAYEEDEKAREEVQKINKKIFERSPEIMGEYQKGRTWSLEHFEQIYKRLGTKFDVFFFESEVWQKGVGMVKEGLGERVFEESEGAVIFRGEPPGLHTRVFVTAAGLPTYEAKELGLNVKKFEVYPDLDESIIVTANEQNDYFKVVLRVLRLLEPEIAKRTKHVSHGVLRLSSGKMSSRAGNVVTAERLLSAVEAVVHQKIAERELLAAHKNRIAAEVAAGAVKFSILRQTIGSDIVFDFEQSISFEGDSGPYIQYTYTRAHSVLDKAREAGLGGNPRSPGSSGTRKVERLLARFPDIVALSYQGLAPQRIVHYLLELSSEFNRFYAKERIIESADPSSPKKIAVTEAAAQVLKNGLHILGMIAPERM